MNAPVKHYPFIRHLHVMPHAHQPAHPRNTGPGRFGGFAFRALRQPSSSTPNPSGLPLRSTKGAPTFRESAKALDDSIEQPPEQAPKEEALTGEHLDTQRISEEPASEQDDGNRSESGDGSGGGEEGAGSGGSGGSATGGGDGGNSGRHGSGGGSEHRQGGGSDSRERASAPRLHSGRPGSASPACASAPQSPVTDTRLAKVQSAFFSAEPVDGAHALAKALFVRVDKALSVGLELGAMADYLVAAPAPESLSKMEFVKRVLMDPEVMAAAAAVRAAGVCTRERWALRPLQLLTCGRPRTESQRLRAIDRLRGVARLSHAIRRQK